MIYELGHIYIIWDCEDHNLVYYGSTKDLEHRIGQHKAPTNTCSSKQIIERGNYEYAILETYENIDKYDLHERERWYIKNKPCINKQIPHRTDVEYRQDNVENIKKKRKIYNNKYKYRDDKKYYQRHKIDVRERQRIYNEKNSDKNSQRAKEWYELNKKKVSISNKEKKKCPYCSKEITKLNLPRHIKICKKKPINDII
tara:strand:+ start:109 stop:705 length:597 start_codon:yes stop_codon:yes gene_type:complete